MPALFRRPSEGGDAASPPPSHHGAPAAPAVVDAVHEGAERRAPFTPPVEAAPPAEGFVLDRRYRIGPLIGTGGMATVHAARDLLLNRDVAVKVFRTRATRRSDMRAQEAEARVIASLNHYALTTLFDAGIEGASTDEPQIYLVMEHVGGGDLRTRLLDGPLTIAETCWLGFDLSEALEYVHQSGFLHRDIKPANVLLSTLQSAKPIVGKLADFGIATLIGEDDDSEFTTGTPAYLAPEQVDGADVSPASDVYSLGLVLLECITGRVEYPGGAERTALARIERDPHIPDDLPELVADVLRRMTAFEPKDRISLTEAALAFQQHLVDELMQARGAMPAGQPGPEATRLETLRSYNILDTAPDETFDTITRIASAILETPIALVTLVDENRVWFKSHLGWDETEVDRDVAFCTTTNPGSAAPWTIRDATADPRTAQNPLVVEDPRVRSYAGAPLLTREGHELGALCVFDHQPREFSDRQLATLADLASLVMHEIEMRDATRRALFSAS